MLFMALLGSSTYPINILSRRTIMPENKSLAAIPSLVNQRDTPAIQVAERDEQDIKQCAICLGNLNKKNISNITLPCHQSHTFHYNCIKESATEQFKTNNEQKCPYCQKEFNILSVEESTKITIEKATQVGIAFIENGRYSDFIKLANILQKRLNNNWGVNSWWKVMKLQPLIENRENLQPFIDQAERDEIVINTLFITIAINWGIFGPVMEALESAEIEQAAIEQRRAIEQVAIEQKNLENQAIGKAFFMGAGSACAMGVASFKLFQIAKPFLNTWSVTAPVAWVGSSLLAMGIIAKYGSRLAPRGRWFPICLGSAVGTAITYAGLRNRL